VIQTSFLAVLSSSQPVFPAWFVTAASFTFGAIVGSFLNVCIHRMPRDESIVTPRSRCYSCNKMISWFDNIPLLSYILLGGKCRHCKAPFSIRYWMVEFLTAVSFVVIWNYFPPEKAFVYTVFISGLIVATFIDFEHYIIPNEITLGGVIVGILFSGIFPSIQGEILHTKAALWSLAGAAIGYGALWGVVELGKRVFGVKKLDFKKPTEILVTPDALKVGDESERWEDIFSRETDTMKFDATGVKLAEKTWDRAQVQVDWQKVKINDETFELSKLGELKATTQLLLIPREAMGFGDVKFIAAIGAFLGPSAVFFVILISSLVGSVVGVTTMLIGKREWGMKLPYGPYLALAALLWIFGGSYWMAQYFQWMNP
jgi:leader peptidase (prepilin peptidase) / N-methyltransferase